LLDVEALDAVDLHHAAWIFAQHSDHVAAFNMEAMM
jgi:hypothetical protein